MQKQETKKIEKSEIAETLNFCRDKDCPIHGILKVRGRSFKGKVTKSFQRRITIEFERMIYLKKYERYAKSKTRIHARLPKCMESLIKIGDIVEVRECRPLSKIIHFVVVKKIKSAIDEGNNKKNDEKSIKN
ncbi:MAG: 30S ribosomal protein S17 [Candidatus Pacearchaeota archaeon]